MGIPVLEASSKDLGEGVLGLYEGFPSPRIRVLRGLDDESLRLVIIHEVLHAIDDMYDLRLGERRIRILEQALGALVDDPLDQT